MGATPDGYKQVELEWSLSQRGTVQFDVPDWAQDDLILDVFWDQDLLQADREDFDYTITEVN